MEDYEFSIDDEDYSQDENTDNIERTKKKSPTPVKTKSPSPSKKIKIDKFPAMPDASMLMITLSYHEQSCYF